MCDIHANLEKSGLTCTLIIPITNNRGTNKNWGVIMKQHGFTLIELLIAIVIIGVLAAVAIPKFEDVASRARCSEVAVNFSTFERLKSFYYEVHGDSKADLNTIGLDIPTSKYFDYSDIMATTASIQVGGDIGTAAKGGNSGGKGSNDAGTLDADGNHGHGNDASSCDPSNPGNPCPGINPANLGSLSGHTLAAVAKADIGRSCVSNMGIYSNWSPISGLMRGDVAGGTCSTYMNAFIGS